MDKFPNSSLKALKAQLVESRTLHTALKDLVEISINPAKGRPARSGIVPLDCAAANEIIRLAKKLSANDLSLAKQVKQLDCRLLDSEVKLRSLKQMKSSLGNIRAMLEAEGKDLKSKCAAIAKVQNEFKTRCKRSFEESLKETDNELRKLLLPLVPSDVTNEHVGFKPINPDSSMMSSQGMKDIFGVNPGKTRNELLLEAIEKTAEGLLSVLKQVTYTYWKNFDPTVLDGLLTPLSETLPECFMFETAIDAKTPEASRYSKENLVSKIKAYKDGKAKIGSQKHFRKLSSLQQQLEKTPDKLIESDILMHCLASNAFTLSETESLVYNLIEAPKHSGSDYSNELPTCKISSGVSPQLPHSNVQKIQLAEKLQSIRSRQSSQADIPDEFNDSVIIKSKKEMRTSQHRLSQGLAKAPTELDYPYSDKLLEEVNFNEVKTNPKKLRFQSMDYNYSSSGKLGLKTKSKPQITERKKVRSVSPIIFKKRQKSISPLRRVSSIKKLLIR